MVPGESSEAGIGTDTLLLTPILSSRVRSPVVDIGWASVPSAPMALLLEKITKSRVSSGCAFGMNTSFVPEPSVTSVPLAGATGLGGGSGVRTSDWIGEISSVHVKVVVVLHTRVVASQ
jgi:hypothetical protein